MSLTGVGDKSRTKRPRNTKIGRKVAHRTCNNGYQFQGQGSRSPGRLMLRPEVHHIFRTERPTNLKLGTYMEYEDHRQPSTSAMTSKVRGQCRNSQGHVMHLTGVGR